MPMAVKSDASRTTGGGGTEQPIDLDHLSAQTLGDRGLQTEVLAIFVAQADEYLRAWKQESGPDEKKRRAHSLKGAARGIGAWRLAELAEKAEADGAGDVAALETELARVCDYIRALR